MLRLFALLPNLQVELLEPLLVLQLLFRGKRAAFRFHDPSVRFFKLSLAPQFVELSLMLAFVTFIIDVSVFCRKARIFDGAFPSSLRPIEVEDIVDLFELMNCPTQFERALTPLRFGVKRLGLRADISRDLGSAICTASGILPDFDNTPVMR
jgi:hypothetical protein